MYRSPLRVKTAIRYRNCLRWQNNVPGSQSHGKQEDSTLFAKAVIRLSSVVPLNAPCPENHKFPGLVHMPFQNLRHDTRLTPGTVFRRKKGIRTPFRSLRPLAF